MPTEAEIKKKVKEAYNENKKPKSKMYIAALIIVLLVAVLFVMTTSVGQNLLSGSKTVTVNTPEDAQRVSSGLSTGLSNIAGTLGDLGKSLGK